MCRAASERVLNEEVGGQWIPVRTPHPITFEGWLDCFASRFDDLANSTTPVSYSEIVDTYRGRKRVNYTQAMHSLSASDVRPSDAYLKTFIKCEKIDFYVKPDPAPRVIQPRNPRYNLAVAVFLKPLEHVIYDKINSLFGATTIMKGLNAVEQGRAIREAWESVIDPVAVDLDASRWDRHVSATALKWEHNRYLKYFSGSAHDRLKRLLSWQINNRCFAYLNDGKVQWDMKGRRASGDMNTALGNVLIMCACIWSWCHDNQVTGFRLINNGDDSVLIISKRFLPILATMAEWFGHVGFLMKIGDTTEVFEQIKFCQTQPVWDGTQWIMCRDPRTVLQKDAHSLLPLDNETNMRGWLASVGDCGLSLAGNLPIFNEYYSWMRRQGVHNRVADHPSLETGMMWLAKGLSPKYSEPTIETRVSFWRAFGLDGTDQRQWEGFYRNLNDVKTCVPRVEPDGLRPETVRYRNSGVLNTPTMRG